MGNTGDKSKNYENALLKIAKKNPKLIVMTAENRALIRNSEKFLKERFIDTGINEQTLIGVASGLATSGYIPVVHALAPFLTMRAFEFIRTNLANKELPVKLMGFIPGVLSDGNGFTHQAVEDIALMRSIPGMEIFTPSCEEDLTICLPAIISSPYPAYVRLNHLPGNTRHSSLKKQTEIEELQRGEDIAILSYGYLSQKAYQAIRYISETHHINCGLLSIRKLKPLNFPHLSVLLEKYNKVIVLEDHLRYGGLRSALIELLYDNDLPNKYKFVNIGDKYFKAGELNTVLTNLAFDTNSLTRLILSERTKN